VRLLDEVEVAAAGQRDPLEQRLVEVGADAEGRGLDATLVELAGAILEVIRIGQTDVGEPVCQEENAVDELGSLVERDLLGAPEPPLMERGRPAGVDRPQALDRPPPGLRRREPALGDNVDLVVVDDQREPVLLRPDPPDRIPWANAPGSYYDDGHPSGSS
jgi:hypothetical protein